MPYDNNYNRRLARQVNNADRNYADRNAFSKTDGLTGGIRFNSGNASKRVDSEGYYELPHLPDVYYEGQGLMEGGHHPDDENEDYCIKGGSGFASGSYRDTGFGSVEGAGASGGGGSGGGASGGTKMHLMPVIKDDVKGCGASGGRRRGRPSKMAGAGVFDGVKNLANKAYDASKYAFDKGKNVYDYGKRLYNKPISTGLELASKGADYMGYGKKKNQKQLKGKGLLSSGLKTAGLLTGNPMLGTAGAIGGLFGLGKKKQLEGAGIIDGMMNFLGLGKKKRLEGAGLIDGMMSFIGLGKNKKSQLEAHLKGGGLIQDIGGLFGLGRKQQQKLEQLKGSGILQDLQTSLRGGTLLGTAETQNVSGGRKKGKGLFSNGLKTAGLLTGNPILGTAGAIGGLFGLGKNKESLVPVAQMQGIKGAGGSGGKKPNKRASIVKKIMKERGVSMIQASGIVKKEGLYKP